MDLCWCGRDFNKDLGSCSNQLACLQNDKKLKNHRALPCETVPMLLGNINLGKISPREKCAMNFVDHLCPLLNELGIAGVFVCSTIWEASPEQWFHGEQEGRGSVYEINFHFGASAALRQNVGSHG